MEARPAERLCQIEIPLAAGDTVEQKNRGMGAITTRRVKGREKAPPPAGDQNAVDIRATGPRAVVRLCTPYALVHDDGPLTLWFPAC